MFRVPFDVVILPEESGKWLAMNVFSRTCLGLESSSLNIMRDAERLSFHELAKKYQDKEYPIWDIEWFSNEEGLLADPTRYIRDVKKWPSSTNTGGRTTHSRIH